MDTYVGRQAVLMLLLLSIIAKVTVPQLCSVQDEEMLKRRRLQGLRAHILAQLGMTEPPPRILNKTTPTPEILEAYKALTEATDSIEREKEKKCKSDEFFAQPISSFVGTMTPVPVNYDDFSGGSLERRSLPDIQKPANALAMFNLTFNLSLEHDFRVVTNAELLLFQVPLTRDDYITALEQYVEIKVVLERLRMKSVVVAKYVKVFNSGFQNFDITAAIQTWVLNGLEGPLNLEVTVFCFTPSCTSPDSEDRKPKSVRFLPDYHSKEHAPRIVVTSQNPLEATSHRSKRQTGESGLSFCVNNQSICCLKQLRINFERDLDFDFIIKPLEYEANYCEGFCPTSPGTISPLLFHYLSRLKNSPASSVAPCCSGNAYQNLNVVILNSTGSEELKLLHRVRVTSCQCA